MDGMVADINKGCDHLKGLTNPHIRVLLKFFYEDTTPNKHKMNRSEMQDLIEDCFENSQEPQQEDKWVAQ